MIFQQQIDGLRERFERLSQRERTLVALLGVSAVVMITLIVGFLITDGLTALEERNSDMRQALRDIETQRDSYLKLKAKSSQLETRIGHTPVQLGGFLEQAAKETGVGTIPETTDHAPVTVGKQWVEKAVELRLSRVKLEDLANFLKKIETGPNLVAVTALSIHTRDDKHQELDVEMTVSTWERAPKDKAPAKKGEKS